LVLAIPRKLGKYFDFSRRILGGYLVSKNTINKNRAGVYRRLENLAGVFTEMQNIYINLVRGATGAEENARLCAREMTQTLCETCPNRPTCMRDTISGGEVIDSFEKLMTLGLKRGNVTFLDLPPNMSIRCNRLNNALNTANSLVTQIGTADRARQSMDSGKILMASLLAGLGKLCKNLASDMGAGVVFDLEKAQIIRDNLLSAGIVTSDCLITKNGQDEWTVSVLVARMDAQNPAIAGVIGKTIGHKMALDSVDDADTSGFAIVTVKTAPRYSLIFGVAQAAKNFNPSCGDSFSFLKINNDKTMMAICDGMGAGERAKRSSVLAISLIENFYRAGFPHEVIMESVNQLLLLTAQEGFSAIDVAVFSLSDGGVSLIKVGGVESFIKRARDVEVVEAGSLPIGIVPEMQPKITRAFVTAGDTVVIVSDGITDGFGDKLTLASFINNSTAPTPQALCDELVREVLNRTDKIPLDDLTVVAATVK